MKPDLPYPGNLSFKDWAEKFISCYPGLNIALPRENLHWTEWGKMLLSNPGFVSTPTSLIELYNDDWQRWAVLMINRQGEQQ